MFHEYIIFQNFLIIQIKGIEKTENSILYALFQLLIQMLTYKQKKLKKQYG